MPMRCRDCVAHVRTAPCKLPTPPYKGLTSSLCRRRMHRRSVCTLALAAATVLLAPGRSQVRWLADQGTRSVELV